MKLLNVVKTNNTELKKKWGAHVNLGGILYVRSNKKGEVNWEKTICYNSEELLKRGDVTVLNR